MILITTALMIEAQPLKAALKLNAINGLPFPVFQNEEVVLVVTGTGAQRSAAATGWALGRFSDLNGAVNIGFAGAPETVSGLNEWYCIHSIRDQSSGRLHVPDRLWKLPFPEMALLTVGKPMNEEIAWDGLVDMEGSGFYEAARQVLRPDRILLFKWVSDHLSPNLDPEKTSADFSESIKKLVPIIEDTLAMSHVAKQQEPEIMEKVRQSIRLTETQWQFLRKWVDGYLRRGGSESAIIEVLPNKPPGKKAENSRKFEELKNVLKG